MTDQRPLAVVLLSGGPDSVVAAALAVERGYRIAALYVDYGQRSSVREQRAASDTSKWLGSEVFKILQLPWLREIGGSAMLQGAVDHVTQDNRAREYVPFRNTILLSLAVAWAETLGASAVVIGSIAGPWITPDNSPEYFVAMQDVVRLGSRAGVGLDLQVPLGSVTKAEMLQIGIRLQVPFELTWSCQNSNEVPCGECNNCIDRSRAFEMLGLQDLQAK